MARRVNGEQGDLFAPSIEAHVARERFDAAALAKGRQVYVSPTNVRVFAQPG